jgi:hypothetical protein
MAAVYPGYRSTPTTSNITIATHGAGTNNTISITGAGTGYNTSVLTATGTSSNWTNSKTTAQGQLHLEGENADLVMNGVSLKEILNGITDRLSILQPKPELLEKYENLREAYEHYKTLEKLLSDYSNE